MNQPYNWQPWLLLVATFALIISIIIPFAQKKYDERRTKRNFQFYLKKQIGLVLNLLTTTKFEYTEPSVKNNPEKKQLDLKVFIDYLDKDFKDYKHSVQPTIIFILLMNIQKLCHFAYQLTHCISEIKFQTITEKTLQHGKELSREELNKIYGLILIYENFQNIVRFHDKFSEIKSINRVFENDIWTNLSVEKGLLTNQGQLNEDLLLLNDNESSLKELQTIILILNQETKKYFNYDVLQSKRVIK